jgi:hypothetical protein
MTSGTNARKRASEPDLDLAAWARELADLFDHAASIGPPGETT